MLAHVNDIVITYEVQIGRNKGVVGIVINVGVVFGQIQVL